MSRYYFILLAVLLSLPVQAKNYNVVFILTDNQSAEALASYGNKDVVSPHIDALAESGMRFENAFAVSGMCSPTRASLLTGLMPSQHGIHNALYDKWVAEQPPGWTPLAGYDSMPQRFADAGYDTAMIGKWHIGDTRQPQRQGARKRA